MNLLEIGKIVNRAIKNKDRYQARIEEIRANPLKGVSGGATAIYDLERNRIAKLEMKGVPPELLEQVKKAVNDALDRADAVWSEFEK